MLNNTAKITFFYQHKKLGGSENVHEKTEIEFYAV